MVRHRDPSALRQAKRMSIREFPAHLGVSDRVVSKWEASGRDIHPRPINQEALDTSLARCNPDVGEVVLLMGNAPITNDSTSARATAPVVDTAQPGQDQVRHPIDNPGSR